MATKVRTNRLLWGILGTPAFPDGPLAWPFFENKRAAISAKNAINAAENRGSEKTGSATVTEEVSIQ